MSLRTWKRKIIKQYINSASKFDCDDEVWKRRLENWRILKFGL